MHRTRNSLAKVIGVAVLGTAFAALGAGAAQALPAVPVAQGALQNSPVSPARGNQSASVSQGSQAQSGPSVIVAGVPVTSHGVPLGLAG